MSLNGMPVYDEETMRGWLRVACDALGSQRAFAEASGISEQHLANVLNGQRSVTDEIARCVGARRVVIFYLADAPEGLAAQAARKVRKALRDLRPTKGDAP